MGLTSEANQMYEYQHSSVFRYFTMNIEFFLNTQSVSSNKYDIWNNLSDSFMNSVTTTYRKKHPGSTPRKVDKMFWISVQFSFAEDYCLVLLCDQNSFGGSKMVLVWPNWFGLDHNDLVTTKMKWSRSKWIGQVQM